MPKVVVSDASPLIGLAAIGKLWILRSFFSQITIAPGVFEEVILRGRGKPGAEEISQAVKEGWIEVAETNGEELVRALEIELDRGEAETLALAIRCKAVLVLIDERSARRVARGMGLKTTGVIGILLRAKRGKLIPQVKKDLELLRKKVNFFIDEDLQRKILSRAGEI